MNEKYIIGAAVGFGLAYVLLSNQKSAGASVPAQKLPPLRPLPPQAPSRNTPQIGIRPWTTAWGNVRPMIAQRHVFYY